MDPPFDRIRLPSTLNESRRLEICQKHAILRTNDGGHLSGNHITQETELVVHLRASGVQSLLHG